MQLSVLCLVRLPAIAEMKKGMPTSACPPLGLRLLGLLLTAVWPPADAAAADEQMKGTASAAVSGLQEQVRTLRMLPPSRL